ncbi:MAG TPA: NUDIX hydrolase [Edaphobacter sp.]|nr:NUDIX hydrolase [Edaphobacter sp.]
MLSGSFYTPRIRGSAFAKTRSNARTALVASIASSTNTTALPSCPSTAITSGSSNSTATPSASAHFELPQGGWESEIDNPEELARGELREETGLLAGRMTELPWMWIAYGFARQRQHVFVVEELTPGPHERDHEEADMEIVRLPITHFEEKLRTGQIRDVCTIAAWGSYQLWLISNR